MQNISIAFFESILVHKIVRNALKRWHGYLCTSFVGHFILFYQPVQVRQIKNCLLCFVLTHVQLTFYHFQCIGLLQAIDNWKVVYGLFQRSRYFSSSSSSGTGLFQLSMCRPIKTQKSYHSNHSMKSNEFLSGLQISLPEESYNFLRDLSRGK